MKTYFIHLEGRQLGPFSIEELKQQRIARNTPVWCEGMADWTTAVSVEELQILFRSTPPPLNEIKPSSSAVTQVKEVSQVVDAEKVQPEKRNNTWVFVTLTLLVSFSIGVFTYQQIQISGLESVIIEKTDSIKELKRISNGQNQALTEITQEQEMRASVERRESLKKQLDDVTVKLQQAKDKLSKLNSEEFTGTPEEKIELIHTQEGEIRSLENQANQINQDLYGAQQ